MACGTQQASGRAASTADRPAAASNVNDYGRSDVSTPAPALPGELWQHPDGYDPNFNPVAWMPPSRASTTPDQLCDEPVIQPSVTLKNNGTQVLTSVTISWNVNGLNPIHQLSDQASGGTTTVSLPAIPVGSGAQVLSVSTSAPNGGVDQNPGTTPGPRTSSRPTPGRPWK